LKTFCEKLIKIDILLSHVYVNKMSMVTSLSEQHKTFFCKKPIKPEKTKPKPIPTENRHLRKKPNPIQTEVKKLRP
jgi:hypothetical protein